MAKNTAAIIGLAAVAVGGLFLVKGGGTAKATPAPAKPPAWWPSSVAFPATPPPGWPANMAWPPDPTAPIPAGWTPPLPGTSSTSSTPSAAPSPTPIMWPQGVPSISQYFPNLSPGATAPPANGCQLDPNMPSDLAQLVNAVLSGPNEPDLSYDLLIQSLQGRGFNQAAACVQKRKAAGGPIQPQSL